MSVVPLFFWQLGRGQTSTCFSGQAWGLPEHQAAASVAESSRLDCSWVVTVSGKKANLGTKQAWECLIHSSLNLLLPALIKTPLSVLVKLLPVLTYTMLQCHIEGVTLHNISTVPAIYLKVLLTRCFKAASNRCCKLQTLHRFGCTYIKSRGRAGS